MCERGGGPGGPVPKGEGVWVNRTSVGTRHVVPFAVLFGGAPFGVVLVGEVLFGAAPAVAPFVAPSAAPSAAPFVGLFAVPFAAAPSVLGPAAVAVPSAVGAVAVAAAFAVESVVEVVG